MKQVLSWNWKFDYRYCEIVIPFRKQVCFQNNQNNDTMPQVLHYISNISENFFNPIKYPQESFTVKQYISADMLFSRFSRLTSSP